MNRKILIASNNQGKVDRYQMLASAGGIMVELCTPDDLGIASVDVEECGTTLRENAQLKARAYQGLVSLPILANDTGFWVEGEGFIDAPKRRALQGVDEGTLSPEEVYERLLNFWQDIARTHGGSVNAAWVEEFVLIKEDGSEVHCSSRRDVLLTDTIYGNAALGLPVRALYISKATGKPALLHTHEEEVLEMEPIMTALRTLLDHSV